MKEPCTDCPQIAIPLPGSQRPVAPASTVILNFGSPQQHSHRLVAQAIPADAALTHGRPACHDDGSLEFPVEGHPDIHGYVRDSRNPRVFHPAWPECVYRVLRVTADKQLVVTGHCNGPLAARTRQPLTTEICRVCPARRAHVTRALPKNADEINAAVRARLKPTGKTANEPSPPGQPGSSSASVP